MKDSQMISRKLLTNLKLFVEEKYLRSRRAPRASTKSSKVQNHRIYTSNCDQNTVNPLKIDDLVILMFVVIRNSLIISKNFWHISNYLSRKNIWDAAEPLVIVPKHPQSGNRSMYTLKWSEMAWNLQISDNHIFVIFLQWKTPWCVAVCCNDYVNSLRCCVCVCVCARKRRERDRHIAHHVVSVCVEEKRERQTHRQAIRV